MAHGRGRLLLFSDQVSAAEFSSSLTGYSRLLTARSLEGEFLNVFP